MDNDDLFLRQLMETFKIEADEHLKHVTLLLIALEKTDRPEAQIENVETAFREIHSLKGAARAVNLSRVESICQYMESLVSQYKKNTLKFTPEVFNVLHDSLDYLVRYIGALNNDLEFEEIELEKSLVIRLEQLKEQASREMIPPALENKMEVFEDEAVSQIVLPDLIKNKTTHVAESFGIDTGTQRVSSTQLSSVLLQSEELLTLKLTSYEQTKKIRAVASTFLEWKKRYQQLLPTDIILKRIVINQTQDTDHISYERLMIYSKAMLEFIDWSNNFIKDSEASLIEIEKIIKHNDSTLRSMIDSLQDEMKQVAMHPFSSIVDLIPKMVRDISADSGLKIEVEITGSEIEIDRRILEAMHDPMIHLIRNCVDHGIEKPEERRQKNKSPVGKIHIEITPRDRMIELVIRDDGRGISTDALREVLKRDAQHAKMDIDQYTTEEILSTVFLSGISTNHIITEMSGRGLGLAIVKEKVEKLGGNIELWSEPNQGSRFQIRLPLTIATFRGILISVGSQKFIIPTRHVERVLRLKKADIHTIENREIIYLNNRSISLLDMADVLALKPNKQNLSQYFQVVIVYFDSHKVAFKVDEVLNEQEVLFKNLGPLLIKVRNVDGATVLGTGEVVPILNAIDLLTTAINKSVHSNVSDEEAIHIPSLKTSATVLIAEDSITTRTLLKNILESSGYIVETAIDGLEAFNKLKKMHFDLVLSDVDMPKMNGFELTLKIRNQLITKDLPVILITALASQADKERGIDVGANAYIIKESFDQSNLLDVMQRLIPKGDSS